MAKGVLNPTSIAGSDNPLVELEHKGKRSMQGKSTFKIFG